MKIRNILRTAIEQLRERAATANRAATSRHSTALHLMKPQLGNTPRPLRPILEPVVAALAGSILCTLVGAGVLSLAVFITVGALIYAILTYVFGIDLAVQVPAAGF